MIRRALLLLPFAGVLGGVGAPVAQTPEPRPGLDWALPAYDAQNTNASPQTAITRETVKALELKWIYQVPDNPFHQPDLSRAMGVQTTPLVVGGTVYVATNFNRLVAIDALTGRELWHFQVDVGTFPQKPWWGRVLSQRTLRYHAGMILMLASDCTLYAIDAKGGGVRWTIPETCRGVPGTRGRYFGNNAPAILGDLLFLRPGGGSIYGGRGFLAAYGLRTRSLRWRWFSVPPEGGDPGWNRDARRGNIPPYPGDWGTTDLIGGGTLWSLIAADPDTGLVYSTTGNPAPEFNAAVRPGPNLYSSSIVALRAATGELIWYYQSNPHDLTLHEPAWSLILATLPIQGVARKVVINGSKNSYVYVLDASTGQPVYEPIRVGLHQNTLNDNAGAGADMTATHEALVGKVVCPGPSGGIAHYPALADGILYVVSQTACGTVIHGSGDILHEELSYKGGKIEGYRWKVLDEPPHRSTLYAIDLATRTIRWEFEMPHRYQSAAVIVSGGVVYAVDRGGVFYALDAQTGRLLRRILFGGLGLSGASLGANSRGEMMLFVPVGGAEPFRTPTARRPGILAAFGLPEAGQ
ncbi:MAG: PQQ-binding-like beta-propeller repeat protein [Candidatus Rokubacteria bacterium]|nr:PQQ-binding-like beta-propeller repeat protein [Candidatus Rokubacteria bacterium]